MQKKKILYLSANMGAGHNAAVRALQEAVDTYYPDQFEHEVLDVVGLIGPTLERFAANVYEKTVKFSKLTYKAFFKLSDKADFNVFFDRTGYSLIKPTLKPIHDAKPDLIVSCFPFLSYSVSKFLKEKRMHIPFLSLITDTGEVHSSWVCERIDCYLAPTIETGFYLYEKGIDKKRVRIFGFPVKQMFYKHYNMLTERRANKLPVDKKVILYFAGAWGSGKILSKLRALDDSLNDVVIMMICGKNARLTKQIKAEKFRNKVITYGFVDNMAELMSCADLIVSKAGGISTMEIITMKKPVVITEVIPGQEEPNARFVESMGFGYVEKEEEDLARRVKFMLETDDLERIRDNYKKYTLNDHSDRDIADFFYDLVQKQEEKHGLLSHLLHHN